jgi:glyoxylase-like metal-dependent hydrolase (beta-lactamase superfamily II)
MKNSIHLDVYNGTEATVNAYLFSDDESSILVDALRNSAEAKSLVQFIKAKNKPLTHVLITHGHPDHYIGINVLKNEFPNVKIVVAKSEIKADIIGFSTWMESVGWLEKEFMMKPKSAANPEGFDYAAQIEVLNTKELFLAQGAKLELHTDYLAAEGENLTTIYNADLNVFLTADFTYNKVHPWLAIDKQNIANWKNQLDQFTEDLAALKPTIYPGHGQPSDISLFGELKQYIEYFEETVASSVTRQEAMEKMITQYPKHAQADFLLFHSINAFLA